MSAIHPSLSIPLSPSSPPESGLKHGRKRRHSDELPDSPASPPLMSIATKNYVPEYNDEPSATAASDSSPLLPTSATMHRTESNQAINTSTNELPTPANSVAGSMKAAEPEDADLHRDKRQRVDAKEESGQDQMMSKHTSLPTNHDRQTDKIPTTEVPLLPADVTSQSAEVEDIIKISESTDQFRNERAEAFFLCKTAVSRSRPDPKQHLIALYGLGSLHRTVARTDPVTGEKINKLRKSYEGQIKAFALAGRNKPVKQDFTPPFGEGRLMTIYRGQPGSEDAAQHFEITPEMTAKLQKAMQMQPGAVRNNDVWEDALGHDRSRPGAIPEPVAKQVQAPSVPRQLNGAVRPQSQHRPEGIRPRRQGKKRSYSDDSFEGYGNGYIDDAFDSGHGGYSDDEDDGGTARKKRKGY